jgi:hypothetical protein
VYVCIYIYMQKENTYWEGGQFHKIYLKPKLTQAWANRTSTYRNTTTVFQLLTSIHNLFQRFQHKLHNIFMKVLSRYMTHFSAFTCISNFIQLHMISMKISSNTWLDRISRDVILFKQKYTAQTTFLKKYGRFELRQNNKYKHTPWNLGNTITMFKF